MRLDGTEIENQYAEFAIDPTEVKAGDVTGAGSEAGNPYGNKINEIYENITHDPTQKYDVLARAMRDPELSETERYGVLMSFCSPTEAGNNYESIFKKDHSVSIGPYNFHDPMGKIEKIPDEELAVFEELSERGDAVVWDDILYSNNEKTLSDSIKEAQRRISDLSKTNPEAAWFLAKKKVAIFGYAVPMENFVLNYRELTGKREEIVRQYTERMGVEKVLDEHRDDIKGEMKNYGLIDRILHRKELREQIAEKYGDEAGNPIRTHEDVEELVERLKENGYGNVVDALDFEALRQNKDIGGLFGIEPLKDDDDAGVYMASDGESNELSGFTEETYGGKTYMIANTHLTNEKIAGFQGKYSDYTFVNRHDTGEMAKKGKSGILKKIVALGAVGLAVAGGVALMGNDDGGSTYGQGGLQNGDLRESPQQPHPHSSVSPGVSTADDIPYSEEDVAKAIFKLTNKVRGESFGRDEILSQVAQGHAEAMLREDYYGHKLPDGPTFGDRIKASGYKGKAGENIHTSHYFAPTAEEMAECIVNGCEMQKGHTTVKINGWMDSPGHRANILGDFDDIGIGVAMDPEKEGEAYCIFFVQNFGG